MNTGVAIFSLILVVFLTACGGSSSSERMTCPSGQVLDSSTEMCIIPVIPPMECPGGQVLNPSTNMCETPEPPSCEGENIMDKDTGECVHYSTVYSVVCYPFFSITNWSPEGEESFSEIIRPCSKARVPGLTQLGDIVRDRVAADKAAGREVLKTGIITDTGFGISRAGEVRHGTHVIETMKFLGVPYDDLFMPPFNNGGDSSDAHDFSIESLKKDIVVIRAATNVFDCDQTDNICDPENFKDSKGLLVVASGNRADFHIEDGFVQNGLGDPEDLEVLIDAEVPVISVSTWGERRHAFVTKPDGTHVSMFGIQEFRDAGGVESIEEFLEGREEFDKDSIEIEITSFHCGAFAEQCITAPAATWFGNDFFIQGVRRIAFGGTSNGVATVGGILSMIKYLWPHLSNRQMMDMVFQTAIDIGEEGVDPVFGHGMLSVQGLFNPIGELVDPSTLLSLEGSLYLPVGELKATGYDSFDRDFTLSLGVESDFAFAPAPIVPLKVKGFTAIPFISQDRRIVGDALSFTNGKHFLSLRKEEDSFLGGYGTGAFRLGDTLWVTVGSSFDFYDINLTASFTHSFTENNRYSVVKDLKGYYGGLSLSYRYEKGNFSAWSIFDIRSGVYGSVYLQEKINYNTPLDYRGRIGIKYTIPLLK